MPKGTHTVVLSPHLDDAVLTVGRFLAASPGTVVVTVFAEIPDGLGLIGYDRSCGFVTSREAVLSRHREDRRALDILGADAVDLDFLDCQYHSERVMTTRSLTRYGKRYGCSARRL